MTDIELLNQHILARSDKTLREKINKIGIYHLGNVDFKSMLQINYQEYINQNEKAIVRLRSKISESTHYNFYLFSRLVTDLLVHPSNLSVPYDMEFKLVYESYLRFCDKLPIEYQCYETIVIHIKSDYLILQLKEISE